VDFSLSFSVTIINNEVGAQKMLKGMDMSDFNSTKYKNEFAKEAYDRASINFPKGKKAVIESHWKAKGYKSLNSYVNALIDADMDS
jgi:hypothetical protein